MAEPMEPADVPQGLIEAAEQALDAAYGTPEDMIELTMTEAIRIILATVLPAYGRQLGTKLGALTFACPIHRQPAQFNPDCVCCQRRAALIGARREIEGRDRRAEIVRQLRRDVRDGPT